MIARLAALALCAAALPACKGNSTWAPAVDASANVTDLGVAAATDLAGCGALFAQVGFSNCPAVSSDGGVVRCTGAAPLALQVVPITAPGLSGVLWSLADGGAPPASTEQSPDVLYAMPGTYPIRLVVMSGSCGQTSARAEVGVVGAPTGGRCSVDAQCGGGDTCVCAATDPDAGEVCPGELAGGFCTRVCTGGSCDKDEECIDFSRTTWGAPELAGQPFRHPICLPRCSVDCRSGFTCRELPALVDGAGAGGRIAWRSACFSRTAWDDGHACADANGKPSPGECAGGLCAPLGARNLCTSPCDNDPCPSTTVCATFNYDPAHPICIPRCDPKSGCTDPLLECRGADPAGWFGFTVPLGQAGGNAFCAPRRCSSEGDCTPAGHCVVPGPGGGGDGGVSDGGAAVRFCLP